MTQHHHRIASLVKRNILRFQNINKYRLVSYVLHYYLLLLLFMFDCVCRLLARVFILNVEIDFNFSKMLMTYSINTWIQWTINMLASTIATTSTTTTFLLLPQEMLFTLINNNNNNNNSNNSKNYQKNLNVKEEIAMSNFIQESNFVITNNLTNFVNLADKSLKQ